MNKSNPGNCLGTADNAMMAMSCASGGTQEPRIRVDAANVVGLRSKGPADTCRERWYESRDGEEGQVRWRVWMEQEEEDRAKD